MAFIFIRHLATAYNRQGLLQGRRDEPTLPLRHNDSADQALLLSVTETQRQLMHYAPFRHILCSPLRRTQETAQAYGLESKVEPLLLELDFGMYEGRPRQDMLDEHGELWFHDPEHLTLGEPVLNLLARVKTYFHDYAHDEGHVLAFAHGAWMRAARAYFQDGSLATMNQTVLANNALLMLNPQLEPNTLD